jgi:type II secretory pathway component PulF
VVPALSKLFAEIGGILPVTTRVLIGISTIITKYWYVVLFLLICFYLLFKLYRRTKSGAHVLDSLKLKLPIFGSLVKKIYLARFCRTMGTLIKAGLPVLEVLKTTKEVVTNVVYQEDIEKIERQVENGVALSVALKETTHFPSMVCQLISVGEASGNLEESLDTLADYFEKEVATTTESLASLIEPILIILIGIAVAIVAISVIKPIYSLSEML